MPGIPEAELLSTCMYSVALLVPEEQGKHINGFAFLIPLKKEHFVLCSSAWWHG
jgi:hypothetical protein